MTSGKPHIIGIAGPSCSGKSEIARHLLRELYEMGPVIVPLDAYYHDLSPLEPETRENRNFDVPEALDLGLLREQMALLASGRAIDRPVYDFSTHTRSLRTERIFPGSLVIVEGLFVLYWKEIRELLDTSIFVTLKEDFCLSRRLDRDLRERGRTRESVLVQYNETVRPMNEAYILPTTGFANIVVNGEDPLDRSTAIIMTWLRSSSDPRFFNHQSSTENHPSNSGDAL